MTEECVSCRETAGKNLIVWQKRRGEERKSCSKEHGALSRGPLPVQAQHKQISS
jgi:hypothetical protein